jgi:formamidase
MARYGSRLVVSVDLKKKPWEQELPLHNRWHPEIPPVAEATTGELFRVEMIDFSGGAITQNYTAEDAKHVDLYAVSLIIHPLPML